ncbi:MAG: DnaJ domain-containing protein [Chloroflexota bacterium]
MNGPDYYQLLGLQPDATDDQIVRAYRRYAAAIHPDRFYDDPAKRSQAEAKIKELNVAMEVLRNPTRRAQYDAKI